MNKKKENGRAFHRWARQHPVVVNGGLVLASVMMTLLVLDWGTRVVLYFFNPGEYQLVQEYSDMARIDTGLRRFEPHPFLSYVPTNIQYATDGIHIGHRFFHFQKEENTLRVACLGGSTTMNKYPRFLQRELEKKYPSRKVEVMDFGCDGWTVTESLLNYCIRARDFAPEVVLIHHAANDAQVAFWPDFQPDYAHFHISWTDQSGWLLRHLTPVSFLANWIAVEKGVKIFTLMNFTLRLVDREVWENPTDPKAKMVFTLRLETLLDVIEAGGGKPLLAPMPRKRSVDNPHARQMDLVNEWGREVAAKRGIPLTESLEVIEPREELFTDMVHLIPEGDEIKGVIFAESIRQLVEEPAQE